MLVLQALKSLPAYIAEMVLLIIVLVAHLGRVVEERRRAISLTPRWPTVGAATCLLLGLVFGLVGQFPGWYGADFAKYPLQWIQNALIMGSYFSLQLLFLPPAKVRPGPLRREVLLFVVVLAVLLVLTGVMWVGGYSNDDSARSLRAEPVVATFYLLGSAYLVYIAGSVALRAARYVARTTKWTASGLALTALGSGMQGAGSALRLYPKTEGVLTGTYSAVVYSLSSPLANFSKPIIVVGLVLPLSAGRLRALRRSLDRRRHYRRMSTLWSVTLTIFPEVEHRPVAVGTGERSRNDRRFTFRYVRRVTECRDGVARVGIPRADQSPNMAPVDDDPLVARFRVELTACGLGAARPIGADLDDEARHLADASVAMNRRGVGWAAGSPTAVRDRRPSRS